MHVVYQGGDSNLVPHIRGQFVNHYAVEELDLIKKDKSLQSFHPSQRKGIYQSIIIFHDSWVYLVMPSLLVVTGLGIAVNPTYTNVLCPTSNSSALAAVMLPRMPSGSAEEYLPPTAALCQLQSKCVPRVSGVMHASLSLLLIKQIMFYIIYSSF